MPLPDDLASQLTSHASRPLSSDFDCSESLGSSEGVVVSCLSLSEVQLGKSNTYGERNTCNVVVNRLFIQVTQHGLNTVAQTWNYKTPLILVVCPSVLDCFLF